MFTSIAIDKFRCFRDFSIGSLKRVNLIAGTNNVGKTALLEAIFLLIGAENVSLISKISAFRGIDEFRGEAESIRELLWRHLFIDFDSTATISIKGLLRAAGQQSVELVLVPDVSTHLAFGDEHTSEIGLGSNGFVGQVLQLQYTEQSGETSVTKMYIDEKGIRMEPVPSSPPFPGFFLAARTRISPQEDAKRFGRLEIIDESFGLLEALKIIEPRLKQLKTIFNAGIPMIYGDIGLGRMFPLSLMGDGLGRMISLLLTIANAPSGIVLVDEIENGLHHSVLSKVWQVIGEAARRFDFQVFATTHSFECIQAAHQAFEANDDYDFRLHRLERVDDDIRAVEYKQDMLETALMTDLEVR